MVRPVGAGRSVATSRSAPATSRRILRSMDHRVPDELASPTSTRRRRGLPPMQLAAWLEDRLGPMAAAWAAEIRARGIGGERALDEVLDRFTAVLVSFLPWMLGPWRDTVDPLWVRAAELFGSVAARRGLAAGEVIEEFQILRELVIRDLYRDPPAGGRVPLSLRDILRLNRGIDRGVTHASVGHTDALFFQFFETGGGGPVEDTQSLIDEVTEQLDALELELRQIAEHARAAGCTT